jgi:hypothetical protein
MNALLKQMCRIVEATAPPPKNEDARDTQDPSAVHKRQLRGSLKQIHTQLSAKIERVDTQTVARTLSVAKLVLKDLCGSVVNVGKQAYSKRESLAKKGAMWLWNKLGDVLSTRADPGFEATESPV